MKINGYATLWAGINMCLVAGCGEGAPRCRVLHGEHVAALFRIDCPSPIGICTVGTISETDLLDGPTRFVGEQVAPGAGLAEGAPMTTVSYSGALTITTTTGALSLGEIGIFDTGYPGGIFVSRDTVTSGTGIFAGASGHLTFRGTGVASFRNDVGGEICLAQ